MVHSVNVHQRKLQTVKILYSPMVTGFGSCLNYYYLRYELVIIVVQTVLLIDSYLCIFIPL